MIGLLRNFRESRRRRVSERDAGMTLVEMLVSMLITSIILAAVATTFIVVTRSTRISQNRLNQYNDGRVALEAMSRTLREAVLPSQDVVSGTCAGVGGGGTCLSAFIQGTASSISFFSNIDNPATTVSAGNNNLGPRKVSYSIDAKNRLVQAIQVPDLHAWNNYNWQYSSCAVVPSNCRTSVLANNVVQISGAPIFTYYANGAALTGSTFSANDLAQVDSIDITFSVSAQPAGINTSTVPTTYLQRVALPNVDTYISETS